MTSSSPIMGGMTTVIIIPSQCEHAVAYLPGEPAGGPVRDHGRRTGGCPSNGRTFIYATGVNCTTEVVQARGELELVDPDAVSLGQGAGLPVQDLPGRRHPGLPRSARRLCHRRHPQQTVTRLRGRGGTQRRRGSRRPDRVQATASHNGDMVETTESHPWARAPRVSELSVGGDRSTSRARVAAPRARGR